MFLPGLLKIGLMLKEISETCLVSQNNPKDLRECLMMKILYISKILTKRNYTTSVSSRSEYSSPTPGLAVAGGASSEILR